MQIPLDDVLRRLLLLGLPLLPLGCDRLTTAVNPDAAADAMVVVGDDAAFDAQPSPDIGVGCPHSFDDVIDVPRPPDDPDAGGRVTVAAWDSCATSGDCAALCEQERVGFPPFMVLACERVSGPADDGGSATDLQLLSEYTYVDCTGRRPAGLVATRPSAARTLVGRWLADAAHLEAASVPAFRRLARELRRHGAPAPLVEAARRAAADEVRHARLMGQAARAHGARPRRALVTREPVRALAAVLAENAREGCVRETFGAITAAHQARRARSPQLRALMHAVARDEARHALLAWAIDDWGRTVVSGRAARALDHARGESARMLALNIAATPPPLVRELGLPTATEARHLLANARDLLWSDRA